MAISRASPLALTMRPWRLSHQGVAHIAQLASSLAFAISAWLSGSVLRCMRLIAARLASGSRRHRHRPCPLCARKLLVARPGSELKRAIHTEVFAWTTTSASCACLASTALKKADHSIMLNQALRGSWLKIGRHPDRASSIDRPMNQRETAGCIVSAPSTGAPSECWSTVTCSNGAQELPGHAGGSPPFTSAAYMPESNGSISLSAWFTISRIGRSGRRAGTKSSRRRIVNKLSVKASAPRMIRLCALVNLSESLMLLPTVSFTGWCKYFSSLLGGEYAIQHQDRSTRRAGSVIRDIGRQIKDLPYGAQIELRVVDDTIGITRRSSRRQAATRPSSVELLALISSRAHIASFGVARLQGISAQLLREAKLQPPFSGSEVASGPLCLYLLELR